VAPCRASHRGHSEVPTAGHDAAVTALSSRAASGPPFPPECNEVAAAHLHPHLLFPQENTTCNIWGNTTDYRHTPTEEDLSRTPLLVGTEPCRGTSAWGTLGLSLLGATVRAPNAPIPPLQNHSNSDIISIDCNVKLAPNEEMNLHLHGNLWMKSLKAVSPSEAKPWGCRGRPLGCSSPSRGRCSAPASLCAAEVQVTEADHQCCPPATLREPLCLP